MNTTHITRHLLLAGLSALFLASASAQGQQANTKQEPPVVLPVLKSVSNHKPVPAYLIEASNKASQANLRGEAYLKAQDADAALACFRDAFTYEPQSSRACLGVAAVYTAKGQFSQAAAQYRFFFYDWPKQGVGNSEAADTRYLMKFALVLLKTGQREEALKVYRQGYDYLPTDRGPLPPLFTAPDFKDADFEAAAETAMGIWETACGVYADAPEDFERAIATQPKLATPYYYRGTILKYQKGRAQDALAAFNRAIELGGASVQTFVDQQFKDGPDEFSKAVRKAQADAAP